jgi:hypothetical protein
MVVFVGGVASDPPRRLSAPPLLGRGFGSLVVIYRGGDLAVPPRVTEEGFGGSVGGYQSPPRRGGAVRRRGGSHQNRSLAALSLTVCSYTRTTHTQKNLPQA